jgi:hypothetical protein
MTMIENDETSFQCGRVKFETLFQGEYGEVVMQKGLRDMWQGPPNPDDVNANGKYEPQERKNVMEKGSNLSRSME